MSYELVQLIRDIAIIVMAVTVALAALVSMIVLLKTYPALRRGTQNFMAASEMMLGTANRISGLVSMGSELATLVWGIVDRIRNRNSGDSDEERQP